MKTKWKSFKDYKLYKIYLKNGKTIKFWSIGKELEKILDDYKIPYEIFKDDKKKKIGWL